MSSPQSSAQVATDVDLTIAGRTDVGRERSVNEDQYLIADLRKLMCIADASFDVDGGEGHTEQVGHLLCVADGLGGHAHGDRASRLAVDAIRAYVQDTLPWFFGVGRGRSERVEAELEQALERAHRRVVGAQSGTGRSAMGTTLTAAYLVWPQVYVAHAGDSRCYLLNDSGLIQLTTDHTLAQRWVDENSMSRAEARESTAGHLLWKALGSGHEDAVGPDVYHAELTAGDTLLLCSDGLTRHVDDAEIASIANRDEPVEAVADTLIDAANAAGGRDNITVVIARSRPSTESESRLTRWLRTALRC